MAKRRTQAPNRRRGVPVQSPEKISTKSPNSTPQPTRYRDYIPWATIFCATLVAYLPALQGSPIWDDKGHLTRADLQSFHGLWRIWFELGATQQYYPLLHSAFWLEHWIWGDAVIGYHLTNIVLHALSACLVVIIMRRLIWEPCWLARLAEHRTRWLSTERRFASDRIMPRPTMTSAFCWPAPGGCKRRSRSIKRRCGLDRIMRTRTLTWATYCRKSLAALPRQSRSTRRQHELGRITRILQASESGC
jgi:hypothetical protein